MNCGFFVTLFYSMLHVMVLTGFETVTHFVKNPKPGYFYSMLEFTVDLTLGDW